MKATALLPIPLAHPVRGQRLFAAAGWLLWLCVCGVTLGRSDTTVKVQLSGPEARFDGWGTSLCWYGNAVGQWTEPQRSEIADLLFSTRGLGLTVVRYNIGGGEKPDHHHMIPFRQMDGFLAANGQWNWDADPGQRWFLQAAIQRGANILEAFSNSPPYWMTVSQCVSGNGDGTTDNLDERFQVAFADYLAEVTQHFRDAWGISFATLDPFNEPYTDYWKLNGRQEGCHFERSSQAAVLHLVRASLDARGQQQTKIAASDETDFDRAIGSFEAYDALTRSLVSQINAHAYATQRRTELRDLARRHGKVLVMSEVDGAGGTVHDHDSMTPAQELAGRIIDDMKELQPTQWSIWQAVEDEASQAAKHKNWGLIHADLQGRSQTYVLTKKYWAMAQFTRFIRPGHVFLPIDDTNSIAAFDATTGTLVVVTRNDTAADVRLTYDLSAFAAASGPVASYRTSTAENLVPLPAVAVAQRNFAAAAKAQSITTFVVTDVAVGGQAGSPAIPAPAPRW